MDRRRERGFRKDRKKVFFNQQKKGRSTKREGHRGMKNLRQTNLYEGKIGYLRMKR